VAPFLLTGNAFDMEKYAVIVAGGIGSRMGSNRPKQFLLLGGKSLLWHSVNIFAKTFPGVHIILVLPESYLEEGRFQIADISVQYPVQFIAGGETRFHSVRNGLSLVKNNSIVFVHDAVRCLVTPDLLNRCYEQALARGSAIPAVAATDSIRLVRGEGSEVADRDHVRIIQTPQTFRSEVLLPAFACDYRPSFTDEATVVEAAGTKIFLTDGEYTNIKITRPADLLVAESIFAERSSLPQTQGPGK